MADLQALPLAELEALCHKEDKEMLDLLRSLHEDDPEEYRSEIIAYLNRPRLPVAGIFDAIRINLVPGDAWRAVLSVCATAAPAAKWNELPTPDLERDIKAARLWLGEQLSELAQVRGVYLGLDTLNMRRGKGTNLEIGGSTACDPASDSQDWVFEQLQRGAKHLIYGLYELQTAYSASTWRVSDETVAQGSHFGFADYTLFLGYSGIILGSAFARLPEWPKLTKRDLLAVWGFHDGDLFLLGRRTGSAFTLRCK